MAPERIQYTEDQVVIDGKFGICPRCEARIGLGAGGAKNLITRHLYKNICDENFQKLDKKCRQPTLMGFIKPMPAKITPKVSAPPRIAPAHALGLSTQSRTSPIAALDPSRVPVATTDDPLAVFSSDPSTCLESLVNGDELWENGLNTLMHGVFGWNKPVEEIKALIRRGPKGLDGLYNFVRYFVEERGVSEGLFEMKLNVLMTSMAEVPPTIPAKIKKRTFQCSGFLLTFPEGMSPHIDYPFPMHQRFSLPWGYEFVPSNSALVLRAHKCTSIKESGAICNNCSSLESDSILQGILKRCKEGAQASTNLDFYSHRQLVQRSERLELQINTLKLEGLNSVKHVRRADRALNDYECLIVAFRSGDVEAVDRILRVGFKRGLGVRGILALYERAAAGAYRPQGYDEDDFLRGLLFWRLGGARLAGIAHRCLPQIPSLSTIRRNSTMSRILISHQKPTPVEIGQNLRNVLSIDELRAGHQDSGRMHAVAMFDEISTEKRIRWEDLHNWFVGVCREHGQKTSLEFNSMEDLIELFQSIDAGEVHYASEATIGAMGFLTNDTRLYGARPVLVSGTCKHETSSEHAKVLEAVLDAVDNNLNDFDIRVTSLASDGEKKRGGALIEITCKRPLASISPIYTHLSSLQWMNLLVGDDDITCDKDYKHIFKRIRNLLLRKRGIEILDRHITPVIIKKHLRMAGGTPEHIRSLFKPDDKQDVPLTNFLRYLIFPYICVDLSLSEQLQYLSAAAHVAISMFRRSETRFFPTLLYVDIMIMIKNVFFCVVKAKVDHPGGKFWIILLGTDRLETLFGILRTIIGTDANIDLLQLCLRLTGTVEVSNILVKRPAWNSSPRRLKLPAISRDRVEVSDSKIDHINPTSWRGDVSLAFVSPQTQWNSGKRLVRDEIPELAPYLDELEADTRPIDIFAPFGTLLFNEPLAADDNEESDSDGEEEGEDVPAAAGPRSNTSREASEEESDSPDAGDEDQEGGADGLAVASGIQEFEDGLGEEDDTMYSDIGKRTFDRHVVIDGKTVSKVRAIKLHSLYRNMTSSMNRLKRVQEMGRFSTSTTRVTGPSQPHDIGTTPILEPGDTIVTVLGCEDLLFLCMGAVTDLNAGPSRDPSVDYVELGILSEDGVTVTFQIIDLVPATSDDDPTLVHDWRSQQRARPTTFTVPGQFVIPMTPTIAVPQTGRTFWLIESQALIAFGQDLCYKISSASTDVTVSRRNRNIPDVKRSRDFPYQNALSEACFVCEIDKPRSITSGASHCPFCTKPPIPLDLSKAQTIIAHISAHVLFDNITGERCGLCGSLSPQCRYFLTKGSKPQVNRTDTVGCSVFDSLKTRGFRYANAAESSAASPCSNVPIPCQICIRSNPKSRAIWKYSARAHYLKEHPGADLRLYEKDWEITSSEQEAMRLIYKNRHSKPKLPKDRRKEKAKKEVGQLVVSEAHSSRMGDRYTGTAEKTDVPVPHPRPRPRPLPSRRQIVQSDDEDLEYEDGMSGDDEDNVIRDVRAADERSESENGDQDYPNPFSVDDLEYVDPSDADEGCEARVASAPSMPAPENDPLESNEASVTEAMDVEMNTPNESDDTLSRPDPDATRPPLEPVSDARPTEPITSVNPAASATLANPGPAEPIPTPAPGPVVGGSRRSGRKRKGIDLADVLGHCECGIAVPESERGAAAKCTRAGVTHIKWFLIFSEE
ncbi:hypothetical protein BDZ89DRAFT_1231061 [Hymenopellis radicata]|nr:hypothetical protein BDZ89DRAFT_1231061 [Hymenopellis radicata]